MTITLETLKAKAASYLDDETKRDRDNGPWNAYLTDADVPSCLVGNILHDLGVDMRPWGEALVFGSVRTYNEEAIGDVIEAGLLDVDEGGKRFLMDLQRVADKGYPWRECIERAWEAVGA